MPIHRPRPFWPTGVAALVALCLTALSHAAQTALPNVVICIADDWSHPHAGVLGDPIVRTPNIDRIAREGAIFTHAFCAAPSCTPSRAALLTGRAPHQLGAGGNLWGLLPKHFETFPSQLENAGYSIGATGKGWGPGNFRAGGREHNPAGPTFKNAQEFLERAPKGKPFYLWFGSQDPHRPYTAGAGAAAGLDSTKIRVPAYWPDDPRIRNDIADYYSEIERFDKQVGEVIALVEARGELDKTIFIVTSDNGQPFPRAKATLYDAGTRVPLIVRYPPRIKAGTKVESLTSLYDVAPTIREASGLKVDKTFPSRSLWPELAGGNRQRPAVFIERERHANVRKGDLSYPARAIRTKDFLYIWNLRSDRWPAGDPEKWVAVGEFGDVDASVTKDVILSTRTESDPGQFFNLSFAKRPAEELYDLRKDPEQLRNVAQERAYATQKAELRKHLETWMKHTNDPRLNGGGDEFDSYPYFGDAKRMPTKGVQ